MSDKILVATEENGALALRRKSPEEVIITDTTLSVPGMAADAEVTGGEIADAKTRLINLDDGVEDAGLRFPFMRGSLYQGTVNTSTQYRIISSVMMSFDREVTFTAKSGFRFVLNIFVADAYSESTGWKTSYTVSSGTTFLMCIARSTDDTTEKADVSAFAQAVTYTSKIEDELIETNKRIDDLKNVTDEMYEADATTLTPTVTAHENGKYISANGVIGTLNYGSYSEPIAVYAGDVLKFTCIANTSMAAISYCNADNSSRTAEVIGESYQAKTYTLISDRTGYVVLSYFTADIHTLQITRYEAKQNKLRSGSVSRLLGKMTLWMGDSIMLGNTFNDSGYHGWYGRIAEACGCWYKCYAEGGACITRGVSETKTAVVDQIEAAHTDYPDADLIVFDGGCNDADLIGDATGEVLPEAFGTWTENDFSGNYDPTTFCGAFETICMKLSQYWLGKHVGYIVPQKMGPTTNGQKKYWKYYETAIAICAKWGIQVLDMWNGTYLNPKHHWMCDTDNTMTNDEIYAAGFLYADRQHLTKAGYDFETPIVNAWVHTL